MTTIKQTHAPEPFELINCEPQKPKRPYGDDKPFIMKNNEEAIKAFKYWLKKQTYNGWTFGFIDKREQPLIGLSLSRNPENKFSRGERAGLIICKDLESRDIALEILKQEKEKNHD